MMFLLKAAFWLGLVLVLLPTGSKKQVDDTQPIKVAAAATAATAAVSDLTQFCTRQPESCAVGSQVATILAQRAQEGAIMVYEFIAERREAGQHKNEVVTVRHTAAGGGHGPDRSDTTGSIHATSASPTVALPRPRPMRSEDTLTPSDRRPSWRKPGLQQEARL